MVLKPYDTIATLLSTIQKKQKAILPIVSDEGILLGIIYLEELPSMLAVHNSEPNTLLETVMEPIRYSVNPHHSVEQVMDMFELSKLNYLPVIEHDQVQGYYSKNKLLSAYRNKVMDGMIE